MFIPATKYINEGFALYLTNIKQSDNMQIRITYSEVNPILEWVKCNKPLLIYDKDYVITNSEPRIISINYTIIKGYYTIEVSYKNGLYVVDNQIITIGLTKGEKAVHINFPQSAYKLI